MNVNSRAFGHIVRALLFAASMAAPSPAKSLYVPASTCEVHRAGNPMKIASYAESEKQCAYTGYFVGGGAPTRKNLARCRNEGTWGWDYVGEYFTRIVGLGWRHPPRAQGRTGTYAPDGPRCRAH